MTPVNEERIKSVECALARAEYEAGLSRASWGQLAWAALKASGKNGPIIVCLCGSGRFKDAFDRAEFDETVAGKIVLTIGCNAHDVAREPELANRKPMLDELHLRKIDLADEVLVLNVDGYIGESTARELAYAKERGKAVRFLEPEAER